MVALFVAGTFLVCVVVEEALYLRRKWAVKRIEETRFEPDLGLCMADGGKPIKEGKK